MTHHVSKRRIAALSLAQTKLLTREFFANSKELHIPLIKNFIQGESVLIIILLNFGEKLAN